MEQVTPVSLEEVILQTEGRPDIRMIGVRNGAHQFNLTPAEAEHVALALLRMSIEAKVRDMLDQALKPAPEPIKTRHGGTADRRTNLRYPLRRLDDKRRARLGKRS